MNYTEKYLNKRIFIHFMKAPGNFSTEEKNEIKKIIYETFEKACKKLDLGKIDIIVKKEENVEELKEMDGVGAFCSPSKIEVRIDIKHPSVKKNLKKVLEKPLFHEFHHAARLEAGEKISEGTFLEALISEGLADNFVYEMVGEKPSWIVDLKKQEKKKLFEKIKKVANKKMSYDDYKKWFFEGSEEENIPRWAGYSLAFKIVKNFIRKHSDKTAASLAEKPAGEFNSEKLNIN